MEFVMNQNLVAWSCRGMCGTKLKNRRALILCHVVSHAVVSCRVMPHMCELSFKVKNVDVISDNTFFQEKLF